MKTYKEFITETKDRVQDEFENSILKPDMVQKKKIDAKIEKIQNNEFEKIRKKLPELLTLIKLGSKHGSFIKVNGRKLFYILVNNEQLNLEFKRLEKEREKNPEEFDRPYVEKWKKEAREKMGEKIGKNKEEIRKRIKPTPLERKASELERGFGADEIIHRYPDGTVVEVKNNNKTPKSSSEKIKEFAKSIFQSKRK